MQLLTLLMQLMALLPLCRRSISLCPLRQLLQCSTLSTIDCFSDLYRFRQIPCRRLDAQFSPLQKRNLLVKYTQMRYPLHNLRNLRAFCTTSDTPLKLYTEWIPGTSANETELSSDDGDRYSILFLHGLLGNGRNVKTLATNVIKLRGNRSCQGGVLMDLRGHGKSYQMAKKSALEENLSKQQQTRSVTFQECVQDITYTLKHLNQDTGDVSSAPVKVVVGHSWGGRLALELAVAATNQGTPLDALWLLDTVPGQMHESVDQVVKALYSIMDKGEGMDRNQLVEELTGEHGIETGIAHWLASSYNSTTRDFGFDLVTVRGLKPEVANQDFVGHLRTVLGAKIVDNTTTQVHLVRGGKNSAWIMPILAEMEALNREFPKTFHLHTLPAAGHWVHVDDLPGLVALFEKYL